MIDQLDPAKGEEMRGEALASLDRLAEAGPLVTPSLGPHAIYTVSAESLAWLAEAPPSGEIPLHIHLSETEQEVDDCLEAHGKRPPPTSTSSASSGRGRCSPTGSGSTRPSSS